MEGIFFGFDFEDIKDNSINSNYNRSYDKLTKRRSRNRNNILEIKQHDKFKVLSKKRLKELLETARDKLKVGFEIEFNGVESYISC